MSKHFVRSVRKSCSCLFGRQLGFGLQRNNTFLSLVGKDEGFGPFWHCTLMVLIYNAIATFCAGNSKYDT